MIKQNNSSQWLVCCITGEYIRTGEYYYLTKKNYIINMSSYAHIQQASKKLSIEQLVSDDIIGFLDILQDFVKIE